MFGRVGLWETRKETLSQLSKRTLQKQNLGATTIDVCGRKMHYYTPELGVQFWKRKKKICAPKKKYFVSRILVEDLELPDYRVYYESIDLLPLPTA